MAIDNDLTAIVIMESFGVVSLLVALLFFRQRQGIKDKQKVFLEALNSRLISERGDGKCFSSEWVLGHIVYKPRKMLSATPYLAVAAFFMTALLYFEVGPRAFPALLSLGYVSIVALVGFAILTETDAFEAYNYSKAIHQVSIEQFDKEDQSYMDMAQNALKMATVRFFMIAIFFAVVGPFIPQIFNGLFNTFLFYVNFIFSATGALSEVSQGVAVLLAFLLPGVLLFLPLLLGRAIFYKAKMVVQKLLRRPRVR